MEGCHKNQQTDQWRTVNPEMDPHSYGHVILHKGTKRGQGNNSAQVVLE